MKTRTTIFTVFFIMLNLLSSISTFAKSGDPISDHFEEELSLTLTTEVTETYCGGCVGSIDLTVSGGQMPYTYSWGNGATTEDIEDLCVGVYGVTVTDALGCTGSTNPFLGQNNYPNVELESQAEVDAYVANYSFCDVVPGVLRIGTTFANPPSDITDISGLSFITSVGSNLFIFQNHNLNSLDGLQNITTVGNSISITNNDGLVNLTGFPSINAINSNFSIDNCASLTSLEGLNQLSSIGGDVYLSNTTNLTSISALSNLQTVDGDLDIRICLDLLSFDGLENLTTINGDLIIRDNIMLNDISALNHSITINGNLEIQNTDLSNCSIIPICEMLNTGVSATVNNNNTGCNSASQILAACTSGPSAVNFEGSSPSCFGLCDGSITVSITGGTAPFLYQWSNGVESNLPQLPNLCADEYTVTVTDTGGLTIAATYQLIEPEAISTTIFYTGLQCYLDCGYDIQYSTSGGTPPYSYSGLPDEICAGVPYTLTTTDANNCSQSLPFSIPVFNPPVFVLDETGDDINGLSNGYFNTSITEGMGPFIYEWYLDDVLVSMDEDPTGLSAGEYTLIVNDNGCISQYGPFTIDAITGIKDFKNQSVRIFPVPAKEYVRVNFDIPISENVPFVLWNAAGALIQSGVVSNNEIIDLNTLGSGVYFLKLKIGKEVLVRKLIKQ